MEINNLKEQLQKAKQEWMKRQIEMYGDPRVLEFIADIRYHGVANISVETEIDVMYGLFTAGYCYYFAVILQEAFPGGSICVCCPYGHVAYVYEGVAYDISGVSDAGCEAYIPADLYGDAMLDFMHIPGKEHNTTDQELCSIEQRAIDQNTVKIALNWHWNISDRVRRQSAAIAYQKHGTEFEDDLNIFYLEHNAICRELENGSIDDHEANEIMTETCWTLGLNYPVIRYFERKKHEEYCMGEPSSIFY